MARSLRVLFASGSKGKEVRADGKGGTLARGYYVKETGRGTYGPFKTKTEANMRAYGTAREPRV